MMKASIFITAITVSSIAIAEETHQSYGGFQMRDISSLSQQDIQALREGSGWGLALPAELNGFPGPAHILDLSDELDLSDIQEQRVSSIFEAMRFDAIAKGEALIEAEQNLDEGFRSGTLDTNRLRGLVEDAEVARANLRFAHLSRHLMTVELLDAEQVATYSVLRGYAKDPCAAVPQEHDATAWRHRNGCEE